MIGLDANDEVLSVDVIGADLNGLGMAQSALVKDGDMVWGLSMGKVHACSLFFGVSSASSKTAKGK